MGPSDGSSRVLCRSQKACPDAGQDSLIAVDAAIGVGQTSAIPHHFFPASIDGVSRSLVMCFSRVLKAFTIRDMARMDVTCTLFTSYP